MIQDKERVLFVCVQNSARSQMAEALLNHYYGDRFVAESAGLEPGEINPLAVAAMRDMGLDIAGNETTDVFDLVKQGRLYSYVITVCDESNAERCPIFPGITKRVHMSFPDPAALRGTEKENVEETIRIRESVKEQLDRWVDSLDAAT